MISKVQFPTFFSRFFLHFFTHLSQLSMRWIEDVEVCLCCAWFSYNRAQGLTDSSGSQSIIRVAAVRGSEPTPSITLFTCWEFLDRVMGIFSRHDFLYFLTINSNTRSCMWGSCCLVLFSWFVCMWSVMIVLWLLLFWIIRPKSLAMYFTSDILPTVRSVQSAGGPQPLACICRPCYAVLLRLLLLQGQANS